MNSAINTFENYAHELIRNIPNEVFEGLASIFCLSLVAFIAWKGFKTGLRYSATLLLIEYVFLIFCSTVIFREASQERMTFIPSGVTGQSKMAGNPPLERKVMLR